MASAVQRRVEKARALIGLVLSVASKAVEEAREGKEPLVAFAGQLACCGGCADTDCYECKAASGANGGAPAFRKCALSSDEQEAMAQVVRAGWADPNGHISAEAQLEWALARWLASFCCQIVCTCAGPGVHPAVDHRLEDDGNSGVRRLVANFSHLVMEENVQRHGADIVLYLMDAMPDDLRTEAADFDKICEEMEHCETDFGELCEKEMDFDGEEIAEEEAEEGPVAVMEMPAGLGSPTYCLAALCGIGALIWGLAGMGLELVGWSLRSAAALLWRGLLGSVTLSVGASVRLVLWVRRARGELLIAVGEGVDSAYQDEPPTEFSEETAEAVEEEKNDQDQEEESGRRAAQGPRAHNRQKANNVAGRRRRAASAKNQSKVWDPGDLRRSGE